MPPSKEEPTVSRTARMTSAVTFVLLAWSGRWARADATVLQNGVAPTPRYAGARDTWISGEQWEQNRAYGKHPTLRCGGQRHILLQFDLSPVPKGHVVHKAVLRLADVGYPRKEKGAWPRAMLAFRLTRAWNENANWLEHTRTDYKKADAGDWATPGGALDRETDFGQQPKGAIATDTLIACHRGHVRDLDVTAVVQRWHAGTLPNHGFALAGLSKRHGCQVASSEWHVPGYRPALLLDHGPKGGEPAGIPALASAPADLELHPIAATPDAGKAAGKHVAVAVGQNDNCGLRGRSTDAYVKEAVLRYPGTWGWMTQCRVGGVAGDFSRALLYFDLSEVPKDASIEQAKLHVSLVHRTARYVHTYRYGAFLLALPDAPGWESTTVTADAPWPKGGVMGASKGGPLALGEVVTKRIEDRRGRKHNVNDAMEFDLTGVARAWVQGKAPNCGVVLDNRIEGGQYDFYGSRSFDPKRRPYLELTISPKVGKRYEPVAVALGPPPAAYWVEPMREVHKRFTGKAGTLAQYGDSITVTMAYLAGYSWAGKIKPKNCPPEVQAEMDLVAGYADLKLWRTWKGGQWGNTGMMRSDWLINNIDGWQKKMNPEASVIMFGTNDLGGLVPPEYTENMAASLRRMMADGTVPMLTSIPPASGRDARPYWLAALSIAHGLRVPLIDYYAEILRRRPDDWDGRLEKFRPRKGYDVPTLVSGDGTHPSNPKEFVNDFSEKALSSNGYNLRDYMTLRKYHEVITKVLHTRRHEPK